MTVRKRMESERYYGAVVYLRKNRHRVVRAGRWLALVNGKLMKSSDVVRMTPHKGLRR